ncbi:MAG: hypothetical protein QF886_22555, partial [Planctomycetota bacterium]|nr:hypothetical protein [Planctomycetota bacterium]
MTETIMLLDRPRCRIPEGDPDSKGFDWNEVELLPELKPVVCDIIPPTEVRAVASSKALHVLFDCSVDDPAIMAPKVPNAPMTEGEHAILDIWPENDPVKRIRFLADFRGVTEASRVFTITGEPSLENVPDLWTKTKGLLGDWSRLYGFSSEGWWVEFCVPWSSLGLSGKPPEIGFNIGRVYITGLPFPKLDTLHWHRPVPERFLEYGEALIGSESGSPMRMELSEPHFGWNEGRILMGDGWPSTPGTLNVKTTGVAWDADVPAQAHSMTVHFTTVPITPDSEIVEFEYFLERSVSSHVDLFSPPRLELEVLLEERVLYSASIPIDRHLGVCVDESYGEDGEASRLLPALADGWDQTRSSWIEVISRKLPRLERRNTNQGAPSDFCLTNEDGEVAANLMADDAWESLAEIILDRFSTTEERLVGSALLIGQKSVTNLILCPMFFSEDGQHTYHSAMHEWMGP